MRTPGMRVTVPASGCSTPASKAQQRGLARAVDSYHADLLPRFDVQRRVFEQHAISIRLANPLG